MNDPNQRLDNAALALDRWGDNLYRIALGMLCDHADAEDAVQETMLRCLRRAPRFRDTEHEKAWLITVTVNICRDMLRRREKRSTVELDAIAELSAAEEDSEVFATLAALPPLSRQIMLLHYVEGYSVKEAANMLGISESAAKMRLKTGRERFKQAYAGGQEG
ncbi:MAG: sigma-70 family RNA polymerase sigma factor [Clostridia bacterium]|nr:sigma-70 family RNA polymerase sigma factor [Clostridia bacterium]